jgi:hypothetical protein
MIKRMFLSLVVITALAFTGGAIAQTDPGTYDSPTSATSPSGTGTQSMEGTSPETQPASPPPTDATSPGSAPAAAPAGTSPASADTQPAQTELPATASGDPLMLFTGILSIAAFVTVLLYRRHRTARS